MHVTAHGRHVNSNLDALTTHLMGELGFTSSTSYDTIYNALDSMINDNRYTDAVDRVRALIDLGTQLA